MKVFLPAKKDANPFLDEIINHSKAKYVFGALGDDTSSFDIVLINWPEQLFDWKEPQEADLQFLLECLKKWKKNTKVVYLVHNKIRHLGMTDNYDKLYQIVISNADVLVHFGKYSYNLYKKEYKTINHVIINHPLYINSFSFIEKKIARKQLNIPLDKLVIIVPGLIRKHEEKVMVLKAFKKVKNKNAFLLITNMYQGAINIKGATLIKKLLGVNINDLYVKFFKRKLDANKKLFRSGFLSTKELSLMMSASDIVFIPRVSALNSGNVFLGMTYKKIIVGPDIGNISEVLSELNMPKFLPHNHSSVIEALNKGLHQFIKGNDPYKSIEIDNYHPKKIGDLWDQLFKSLH